MATVLLSIEGDCCHQKESMIDTLARLIEDEYKQVQGEEKDNVRGTGLQDRTRSE
jgi:hypothetical protein